MKHRHESLDRSVCHSWKKQGGGGVEDNNQQEDFLFFSLSQLRVSELFMAVEVMLFFLEYRKLVVPSAF